MCFAYCPLYLDVWPSLCRMMFVLEVWFPISLLKVKKVYVCSPLISVQGDQDFTKV